MHLRRAALIGLTGVETTTHYARLIGEEIKHRFGGTRRADLITLTLSEEVFTSQGSAESEATRLVAALGAEAIVMCANERSVEFVDHSLEVISVFDTVRAALRKARVRRIAMIGVASSAGEKAWQKALDRAGIMDVLLPLAKDRDYLTTLIEHEFAHGLVTEAARADVVRVAHSVRQAGARALVVVAPQLTAVLEDAVPVLPIFDVAEIHAMAVVNWMTASSTPVHRVAQAAREFC